MNALVPLVIALTGLPALGIAVWFARSGTWHDRRTALHWALIAMAILLGAVSLYFASGHATASMLVVLAMVVAVNALAVSMFMHLRRGTRGR